MSDLETQVYYYRRAWEEAAQGSQAMRDVYVLRAREHLGVLKRRYGAVYAFAVSDETLRIRRAEMHAESRKYTRRERTR